MSNSEDIYYVYVLFREKGIPFYVGKGKNNRCYEHEKIARRGVSYKDNIIYSLKEKGVPIKVIKVAENLSEQQAYNIEILLIKILKRHPYGPLANATNGGDGAPGRVLTPEALKKMSLARKGKPQSPLQVENSRLARIGLKRTPKALANLKAAQNRPEVKEKLRKANLGKKMSPEAIEKTRKANIGRTVSLETRLKMRLAGLGKKDPPEVIFKRSVSIKNTWARRKGLVENSYP